MRFRKGQFAVYSRGIFLSIFRIEKHRKNLESVTFCRNVARRPYPDNMSLIREYWIPFSLGPSCGEWAPMSRRVRCANHCSALIAPFSIGSILRSSTYKVPMPVWATVTEPSRCAPAFVPEGWRQRLARPFGAACRGLALVQPMATAAPRCRTANSAGGLAAALASGLARSR